MGKPKSRFVAKAEADRGWRIWDKQQKKWWGERYKHFPGALIIELNSEKRPEVITALTHTVKRRRVRATK
jgi:hypothetical protein